MSEELEDKISDDGLRYVAKRTGASFSPMTASSYATISRIFCGVHRGASQRCQPMSRKKAPPGTCN